jgi:hypothetical protein
VSADEASLFIRRLTSRFASLVCALCFEALWLGILAPLYRRNIIVKMENNLTKEARTGTSAR